MRILLNADDVQAGVRRLAADISRHHGNQPLTVLGVMTGSIVLMADLIRQLSMPLQVGVVQASSYKMGTRRGELRLNEDFLPTIHGRHVLLIDDIFDTGHTLAAMTNLLRKQQPASLRTAVLLFKQGRRAVDLLPDHVVFEIPDLFVVGYGLDYRDRFRELPHVAVLEPGDLPDGATL